MPLPAHINQARGHSSYDSARANGATMRIDVARSAVTAALDAIGEVREFDEQVTVGLYRFTNTMTEILSPTSPKASDLTYAKSQVASQIMLDMTLGGTNQEEALRQIAKQDTRQRHGTDRQRPNPVCRGGHGRGGKRPGLVAELLVPATAQFAQSAQADLCGARGELRAQPQISARRFRSRGIEISLHLYRVSRTQNTAISVRTTRRAFGFITNSLFPIMPTRMATCAGKADNVLPANTPQEIHDTFVDLANRLSIAAAALLRAPLAVQVSGMSSSSSKAVRPSWRWDCSANW